MRTIGVIVNEGFSCKITEDSDGRVFFTADADIDADSDGDLPLPLTTRDRIFMCDEHIILSAALRVMANGLLKPGFQVRPRLVNPLRCLLKLFSELC
jgi:hypothetical protein